MKLPTYDIKDTINSRVLFKPEYYDIANELIKLPNYSVIHIRCADKYFSSDLDSDATQNLLLEISNLNLSTNTFIMSNNYMIKKIIGETLNFHFINKRVTHTADENCNEMETSIIEYIILSKSSQTFCFTSYPHGSGFSEQCSVLNNIPYQVKLLPSIFTNY
jgi:hypothetical protein